MKDQVRRHSCISRMLWVSVVTLLFILLEAVPPPPAPPGALSHQRGPVFPFFPASVVRENHRRSGHFLSRAPRLSMSWESERGRLLRVRLGPTGLSRSSQGAGRRGRGVSCVPFTKSKQPSSNRQDWTRSLEGGHPHALSSETHSHLPSLIGGVSASRVTALLTALPSSVPSTYKGEAYRPKAPLKQSFSRILPTCLGPTPDPAIH